MAKQCCEHDDGNCDHREKKKNGVVDLADPVNTICVFVEGGVVQNVTGIPPGVKLLIIDYDIEGLDLERVSRVKLSDDHVDDAYVGEYEYEGRDGEGLTAEQRKQYLDSPGHCPFCNGTDISADRLDCDGNSISQEVECENCGKHWRDCYRLDNVYEIE